MTKDGPKLLTGGNPQIAKGDGMGPVQAYIAAMPGWKHGVGVALDRIFTDTLPQVQKAVKWNTPLYGQGGRWFMAFNCTTRYVKVAFFQGTRLDPIPPVSSNTAFTRYLHVFEGDTVDAVQLADWVRQAARLPGTVM
ncbi:MAG: DUF1801 domain-containing protein [Pseudorhodobacter sp.]|nr:DUF1801 domain-containing protein [Pseudorhodobacter sp.]